MLMALFTALYFLVCFFLIDLVFRNFVHPITDILSVVCWVIALVVSVGLADRTVRRIKRK